ncbi:hypothetical protein D3C85_1650370 [compost metagenome]
MPGLEVTDNAVAIGGAAAHVGGQAVADPAFAAGRGFFGVQRVGKDQQGAYQATAQQAARARGAGGKQRGRRRNRTRDRHDGLRVK